ncbi:DNA-formamidopyrimidine glycosylase family protein [Pedococcus sp. NPDC057267]|uniref:DNA-formamidopyrimidine glycosylase family protein n=1 Tax=Pedococcus sp. NPDC057267 TaxID=3346077 RepID=UPI0036363EF2
MPKLPEVESARAVVEATALGRRIADVDDSDTWECRPHAPGEIGEALVGRRLTAARRRGKSMWCDTSGTGRSATPGPALGLHLGMSGRILVTDADGRLTEGGDYLGRGVAGAGRQADRNPVWVRFALVFEDGGTLRLFDKRRLGRVRLDPEVDALGPDVLDVRVGEFRELVGRGRAPVKARLLDQSVLAGVGNLLADETLWQAGIDPRRRVDELDDDDLSRLHRALRRATRAAIARGGVHTGEVVPHRGRGGHCPRCGAEMACATVGGRTTWWCPVEQV